MQKCLRIDRTLQFIQGKLVNNTLKLTKIDKRIKCNCKKLKEIEADPTYSEEQRQLYRDRLEDLNSVQQARL